MLAINTTPTRFMQTKEDANAVLAEIDRLGQDADPQFLADKAHKLLETMHALDQQRARIKRRLGSS